MRRGFTLIELLVVIAIISILAAILFPVFAQAKNAAKGAVCLSNMMQISLAGQMYMNDTDDVWFPSEQYDPLAGFPPQRPWIGFDNSNAPFNGSFWGDVSKPAVSAFRPGSIDVYIKNEGVKKCPNQPQSSQLSLALSGFNSITPSAYYTTNAAAAGNEYGPSMYNPQMTAGGISYEGVSATSVDRPAETLMAWEHLSYAPICNFIEPYDWFNSPPNSKFLIDHFNFLHTNATNTVWCDGHAKRWTYFALKRPMFSARKDFYPGM